VTEKNKKMTTWETLQLDRQTATPLTVTTDRKENKKKKPNPSEVFCFLPAHRKHICKAAHSRPADQNFAKKFTLANPQRVKFETLFNTGLCR